MTLRSEEQTGTSKNHSLLGLRPQPLSSCLKTCRGHGDGLLVGTLSLSAKASLQAPQSRDALTLTESRPIGSGLRFGPLPADDYFPAPTSHLTRGNLGLPLTLHTLASLFPEAALEIMIGNTLMLKHW